MGFTPLVKLPVQRYRIFPAAIIFCLRVRFFVLRVKLLRLALRILDASFLFSLARVRDNRYIVEFFELCDPS